jgi:hypothetical protein
MLVRPLLVLLCANALTQLRAAISRQPRQWKAEAVKDPAFASLRTLAAFQELVR